MAKKKSCFGCRALNYSQPQSRCDLGYSIRMNHENIITLPTPVPVSGKCPKPRTYGELDRLLEEKNGK
jgi:hypothetical protein